MEQVNMNILRIRFLNNTLQPSKVVTFQIVCVQENGIETFHLQKLVDGVILEQFVFKDRKRATDRLYQEVGYIVVQLRWPIVE